MCQNQFFQNDFFCSIEDAVHSSYPFHLTFFFVQFSDAILEPVLIQTAGDLVQVAADFSVLGCEFPNGKKSCITEAAEAATAAVDATSQTYVDALKNAGKFDAEAQEEFAKKALTACLQSISPAAQRFIESAYDGIREYLTTRIEAKMRKQKGDAALALSVPMLSELVSTVETTVKKTDLNVGAMRTETA